MKSTIVLSLEKGIEMVERNMYESINRYAQVAAVVAKMLGYIRYYRVCIREMAPGMWKVWAPEVSDKGLRWLTIAEWPIMRVGVTELTNNKLTDS